MKRQDQGRPGKRRQPETGRPKARRVSHRKELAVVTLGMVAAISGIGGLLAANPPSRATADVPAAEARQITGQQPEPRTDRQDDRLAQQVATGPEGEQEKVTRWTNEDNAASKARPERRAIYSATASASVTTSAAAPASAPASASAVSQGS